MSTKKKRRPSLSPEEKLMRSIRARRRFKALVRMVIANLYWLEDADDGEIGDNVLKNVQMLTKKKGKKTSLLTLKEKSILNKNKLERTEAEKNHLNRVIGGFKCFRRYPANVKSQLAACTYFLYLEPGRVIVKQDDEAYALYFILDGEVLVTQTYYDKLLKEHVTVELGTMQPGSMFGEVSLLHGIKRTATITTLTDCELLFIKREDFDIVLKATVLEEWDDIQRCMSYFEYFKGWDEVATRECCILGKKRFFEIDETILGDGYGAENMVHFVVAGCCEVIEHLVMESKYYKGRKVFKLCSQEFINELISFDEEAPRKRWQSAQQRKQMMKAVESMEASASKASISGDTDAEAKESVSMEQQLAEESSRKNPAKDTIRLPTNIEIRFIRVCLLNALACFNLGENLQNRRIVAKTRTECLLIPSYWLFQKNKANIWNRVQQYLNQRIPTTQQIFKNFLDDRKWVKYRRQLQAEIRNQKKRRTYNSINNVPYSIRIKENVNYD